MVHESVGSIAWPVATAAGGVRHLVLLHGLASTPKEFGLLIHPLRRQGISVHAPEIRGYSHGSLSRHASWRDWVDAAGGAIRASVPTAEPFVLGGLCSGAVLALGVQRSRRWPSLRGLALLSPLFAYDGWGLPWWYKLRLLAYWLRLEQRLSMAERPPYGLKNERLRQWVQQQMMSADHPTTVGPGRVSLQLVHESERMSRVARAWLPQLNVPTVVMHAREDEICRLSSVQAAISSAPPHLLSLTILENSYHMVTADNDRRQVAEVLAAHTQACISADRLNFAAAAA